MRGLVLVSLVLAAFLVILPAGARAQSDLAAVLSKFDAKIYGRVKVDVNYDTAQFVNYNDFIGAVSAEEDYTNDSTNFNPRDSRVGLTVNRLDGSWLSEGRIEIDFYGDTNGSNLIPRMRLGYVKLSNQELGSSLTVGQDWIPVAYLNPPTVDFGIMTAGGNLWWRVPQLTLRQNFGENWQGMLGVMKHRRQSTAQEDRMPWAVAGLSYENGGLHLGINGGYRSEKVAGTIATEEIDRWLASLALKYSIAKLTFLFEPWMGAGIDDEFLRYDLGVNTTGDRPKAIKGQGGFVSANYDITDAWSAAVGYGVDDPKDGDLDGRDFNNRTFNKNQQAFANAWYKLTEAVMLGGEVLYVETSRDDTRDGWRFTFSTLMSF